MYTDARWLITKIAVLALVFIPAAASAESLTAGFTSAPVWLSTSDPIEGDRVEAYTVVYNASDEAIEGSLSFLIDGKSIGATPFSLRAGETEVQSVRWTAVEGTHDLGARIDTAIYAESKREADLPSHLTATTTIHVAAAPKKEHDEKEDTVPGASSIVSTVTSNPALATIINTIVNAGEGARTATETIVADYAGVHASDETVATGTDKGLVLGTSTVKDTSDRSLTEKAAGTVLPLFAYPALFYPFLLFILIILFWLVARRVRNPRRRRRR